MKRCKDFEELMVDSLYGETDIAGQKELDEHLAGCPSCARLFGEMRGTLDVMSRRERRDPGAAWWAGYWDRLAARMESDAVAGVSDEAAPGEDTRQRLWWRRRVGGPRVAPLYRVAAAAAILVIGIYVGRTFFAPAGGGEEPIVTAQGDTPLPVAGAADTSGDATGADTTSPAPVETNRPREADVVPGPRTEIAGQDRPAGGGDAVLASSNERAMRYVEKSQVLLLGIINTEPDADGYASSIDQQRARSRELVDEASSIKDDLSDPRQRRLRELVDELQKILVQIANLEDQEDLEEVEFIRSRVNSHDVLLKINLEQLQYGPDGAGAGSGATDGAAESEPGKGSI